MIAPCPYTLPTVSLVGGTTTPLLFELDYFPSSQRAAFAVINYIFKYGEPLITLPMELTSGKLSVILPSSNTMKMLGKYIYQVTMQNADGTRKVLQGLLYVHKNINANDSGVDPFGDRSTIMLIYNSEHGNDKATQWTKEVTVWSGSDYTLSPSDFPSLSADGWRLTGWDRQSGDILPSSVAGSGVASIDNQTGSVTPATITGVTGGNTYSSGDTFYVTCDHPCAVGISFDGWTTYAELRATATDTANKYRFTLPLLSGNFTIGVGLFGDVNSSGTSSGTVRTNDATQIGRWLENRVQYGKYEKNCDLSGITMLTADVDHDGAVTQNDVLRIQRWLVNQAGEPVYDDNCEIEWNTTGGIDPNADVAVYTINANWAEVVDENIYVYYGQAVPVDATTGDPDRDAAPDITGFTKEAIAPDSGLQHTITFSTNTGANEYSYFLAPNRVSAVAFRYMFPDQGTPWPGGYTEMTDISMTISGEAYRVWRSTNANLGAMETTVGLTIAGTQS